MAKNELLPRVDYVSAFANARYKNFFLKKHFVFGRNILEFFH